MDFLGRFFRRRKKPRVMQKKFLSARTALPSQPGAQPGATAQPCWHCQGPGFQSPASESRPFPRRHSALCNSLTTYFRAFSVLSIYSMAPFSLGAMCELTGAAVTAHELLGGGGCSSARFCSALLGSAIPKAPQMRGPIPPAARPYKALLPQTTRG